MHTSPHARHDLDAHGLRRQVEHRDLAARTGRSALLALPQLADANTGTPAESLSISAASATGARAIDEFRRARANANTRPNQGRDPARTSSSTTIAGA